jgi:hypothetical protein
MVRHLDTTGTIKCSIYPVRAEYASAIKQCFAEEDFFSSFTVEPISNFEKITSILFHYSAMPSDLSKAFDEVQDRINDVLDKFIDRMCGYHVVQA